MQRAKNENAETQVHDIKKEKPKSRPLEKKYRYKLSGIIDIYSNQTCRNLRFRLRFCLLDSGSYIVERNTRRRETREKSVRRESVADMNKKEESYRKDRRHWK